jgi:diadenosine tetraphosphate (Ap4A) HIT family hydrolase
LSVCPFCELAPERIMKRGNLCLVFADAYPVSRSHTLVIPKRHVASLFETTAEERSELFSLLAWCRGELIARHNPAGFNIGINDGKAAGQTVMHLHIHLIPRYAGDKSDPRGGVRWIFPDKADYWSGR